MAFPDFMAPHFESVRFSRTPAADFTVGERTYGVFSHNWIQDPIAQWLVDTKHAGAALTPSSGLSSVQTVALSEAEFAHAVRQALRDFTRPDLLATNPLLPRPTFQHVPPPSQRRHRPGSHCTMAA